MTAAMNIKVKKKKKNPREKWQNKLIESGKSIS